MHRDWRRCRCASGPHVQEYAPVRFSLRLAIRAPRPSAGTRDCARDRDHDHDRVRDRVRGRVRDRVRDRVRGRDRDRVRDRGRDRVRVLRSRRTGRAQHLSDDDSYPQGTTVAGHWPTRCHCSSTLLAEGCQVHGCCIVAGTGSGPRSTSSVCS